MYTDIGLMTSDPDIGSDASELFNYLTGFSKQDAYRKFMVAPVNFRRQMLEFIERETTHGEKGRIIFKINSLVDAEMIAALYRASQAGVQIDLNIRGICCLRPGIEGVSDNIRVLSIVGRFLEHSRIYYFHNMGRSKLYVGSGDLMPRNIDRRVEVLFPVDNPILRQEILENILEVYLKDTERCHILDADGVYRPAREMVENQADLFSSQEWLLNGRITLQRAVDEPVLLGSD
jgi:polyphosphate kinase